MMLTKFLLIPILTIFLIAAVKSENPVEPQDKPNEVNWNILDDIMNQVDKKMDEELNVIDFSKEERTKFKDFVHKGIKGKSLEELTKSRELIITNTETLIEQFKDQNTTCKTAEETINGENYVKTNRSCFDAFVTETCPLYPFC